MSDGETQNAEAWTLFGSIGAALGAAICCLGPVVLVSIGVGGAWIGQLSALEPYRPLFMAVAATFLGFGFYRAYGGSASGRATEDGECADDCEVPKAQRINRVVLWTATAVVAGLFASPYILEAAVSNSSTNAPDATATPSAEQTNTAAGPAAADGAQLRLVELKVEGMTCAGCVQTLTSKLEGMDGVESADVTLEPPRATVEYDPAVLDETDLTDATESIGYPSTVSE